MAQEREYSDKEMMQKDAVLDRKTKVDLQLSQEETRRKAALDDLTRNVAAGSSRDTTMHSVVKTLKEFLSKYFL